MIDYGVLAISGFIGGFLGAIAKDVYDFIKKHFRKALT